jgi:hypothetical protein
MHTFPHNAVLIIVGMRARKASRLVEALSSVEVAVPLCGGGFTVRVASCRDTAAYAMATGGLPRDSTHGFAEDDVARASVRWGCWRVVAGGERHGAARRRRC